MPTLYIANKNYSSWSLRPWVLLRELGIAFEERLMPFTRGPDGNFITFRTFAGMLGATTQPEFPESPCSRKHKPVM